MIRLLICLLLLGVGAELPLADAASLPTIQVELPEKLAKSFADADIWTWDQAAYPGIDNKYLLRATQADFARTPHQVVNGIVLVHYPQKTGNKQVDALIEGEAKRLFALDVVNLENYMSEENSIAVQESNLDEKLAIADTTYAIFRSPAVISLLLTQHSYFGGAHDNIQYVTRSYDVVSGKLLQLEDLFPDIEKSVPLLIEHVKQMLATRLEWSEGRMAEFTLESADISMDRIVLREDGIEVIYSPYEQASFAEGEQVAFVGLADLIQYGVDERFWKQ